MENKAEDFQNFQSVTEDKGFYNLQLQFSLLDLLSSQPDCFKVNKIIFIMIKILMTLRDQSNWCILKNEHLCQPLTATTVFG